MNEEVQKQIEKVRAKVDKYYEKNIIDACPMVNYEFIHDNEDHIKDIATSIYCTKHNIGYPGGNFVQAVVNNNLFDAFGYADNVNYAVLRFYVMMLHNM